MRQAMAFGKDARFQQLMALADEGDEAAIGDLYREFGVAFGARSMEARHDR